MNGCLLQAAHVIDFVPALTEKVIVTDDRNNHAVSIGGAGGEVKGETIR